MSEPDLGAIAHYLKLLPPTDGTPPVTMPRMAASKPCGPAMSAARASWGNHLPAVEILDFAAKVMDWPNGGKPKDAR